MVSEEASLCVYPRRVRRDEECGSTNPSARSLVRMRSEMRRALDVLLLLVWMIHIAACYWNLLGSSNEKNGDRYVVVR